MFLPEDFRRKIDFLGNRPRIMAKVSALQYWTKAQSPTEGKSKLDPAENRKAPVSSARTSLFSIPDEVAVSVDCGHASDAAVRSLQLLLLLFKPLVKTEFFQFHAL